jgi:hypothetical protein
MIGKTKKTEAFQIIYLCCKITCSQCLAQSPGVHTQWSSGRRLMNWSSLLRVSSAMRLEPGTLAKATAASDRAACIFLARASTSLASKSLNAPAQKYQALFWKKNTPGIPQTEIPVVIFLVKLQNRRPKQLKRTDCFHHLVQLGKRRRQPIQKRFLLIDGLKKKFKCLNKFPNITSATALSLCRASASVLTQLTLSCISSLVRMAGSLRVRSFRCCWCWARPASKAAFRSLRAASTTSLLCANRWRLMPKTASMSRGHRNTRAFNCTSSPGNIA